MSDPDNLAAFLDLAWQHLEQGVADANSPARLPAFATVSPGGTPEIRTVALRRADRADADVDVHTDIETPKIASLRNRSEAALMMWIPSADLQIRLTCNVEILAGDSVAADWDRVPPGSRVSYGTQPIPGTPIDHVHAYQKPADPSRFAVLRCQVQHIDLVELGETHRRAVYMRDNNWAGTWVAP